MESLRETVDEIDNFALGLALLGTFMTLIGLGLWIDSEESQENILKRGNLHLPNFSKNCQSCGCEFNSLIKYSKEDDKGKINYNFCSKCDENGAFIQQNLTLKELKDSRREEFHLKAKSEKFIKKHLRRLEKLDRWKKNLLPRTLIIISF